MSTEAEKSKNMGNPMGNLSKHLDDNTLWGHDDAREEKEEVLESFTIARDELDIILDSREPFVLINAYKGSGKTTLFLSAAKILGKDPGNIIAIKCDSSISPMCKDDNFDSWIIAWRRKISECISIEIANRVKFAWKPDHIDIIEHARKKGELKKQNIFSFMLNRLNIKTPLGDFHNPPIDDISTSTVKRAIDGHEIWLFIDEVDQDFKISRYEMLKISSLLKASRELSLEFTGLKIRISIRPNVWATIEREFASLSGMYEHIVDLKWTSNDLKRMISKRISSYIIRNNLELSPPINLDSEESDEWYIEQVFSGKYDIGNGDRPPHMAISKWSANRPRWMIELCREASRNAKNHNQKHVLSEHFIESMSEFGRRRVANISAEFKSECEQISAIISAFTKAPRLYPEWHNICHFIRDNIVNKLDIKISGLERKPSEVDVLNLLYRINFIQAKERLASKKRRQVKYSHYMFAERPDLLTGNTIVPSLFSWEIHPIFKQYLGLTEAKEPKIIKKISI